MKLTATVHGDTKEAIADQLECWAIRIRQGYDNGRTEHPIGRDGSCLPDSEFLLQHADGVGKNSDKTGFLSSGVPEFVNPMEGR